MLLSLSHQSPIAAICVGARAKGSAMLPLELLAQPSAASPSPQEKKEPRKMNDETPVTGFPDRSFLATETRANFLARKPWSGCVVRVLPVLRLWPRKMSVEGSDPSVKVGFGCQSAIWGIS